MFNRDLKFEIAALKDKLIENSEELERYKKKFAASENDLRDARASRHEAEQKIQKLKKEIREVKKLTREQTEADLLINALKAVGIIKDEPPKQLDRFAEAERLSQQYQQLSAQQCYSNMYRAEYGGSNNIFGGIFR